MGEIDGEDQRAGLRIVEVILPAPDTERSLEIRLGIHAGVVRPRLQVARGEPELDHREPGELPESPVLPGVRCGELAELHVARVLDALSGGTVEVVPEPGTVPVLADRNGLVRPGTDDAGALLD